MAGLTHAQKGPVVTLKQKLSIALIATDIMIAAGGACLALMATLTGNAPLFAASTLVFIAHIELANYHHRDYQENR